MVNLSNEQIEFLNKLSNWVSSEECNKTVYNKICSALTGLIQKKEKSRDFEKVEILKEDLCNEIENHSNDSKYSRTSQVIDLIKHSIKKCYEGEDWGKLLSRINNIHAAKEHLLATYVRILPSDSSLEREINNRKINKKIYHLISILDEWINNSALLESYSKEKVRAIQNKYQNYKEDFESNLQFPSISVLSKYIDRPNEAKEFLSELFTEEQESFYSKLEKWTETLADTKCGEWLCSYLRKGRDLRFKDIEVLKYIDNEDKAKAFLISKYEEKLEKKKKKYSSIFETYDEYKNSLCSLMPGLTKSTKLYSKCLSSNTNGKISPFTVMSYEDGIEISEDCISLGLIVYHLSLKYTNHLFYTYSSTYRKKTTKFTFLSHKAIEIVKNYCSEFLDSELLNHTRGIVIIREDERVNRIKCYSCLLTDEASQFDDKPLFVYNSLESNSSFYHDIAGFRLIFKAFIWHLLSDKSNKINYSAENDYSKEERDLIFDLINQYYDSMSYDEKYICHFIDTDKYKFPDNKKESNIFNQKSYKDRIINLRNCICSQYNSQVLEDRYFQFARIEFEYGDTNFNTLANTIGAEISKGKYLDLWFDNKSTDFLLNLRVLTFLNWAYVSSKTGNVKKITSCWLMNIIYNQYKESYDKDKNFWTLMLAYTLIENESIYNTLINILRNTNHSIDNCINVASIVFALTKDIKLLKKRLSFKQEYFLSNNIRKNHLFEDYLNRNKKTKQCKLNEAEAIINNICNLIKANHGTNKDYSKQSILEILSDVPKFQVPDNFTYTNHRRTNYDRYNGDYRGTYAHDEMGYSNSDIDTIFEGDPDAYWNID